MASAAGITPGMPARSSWLRKWREGLLLRGLDACLISAAWTCSACSAAEVRAHLHVTAVVVDTVTVSSEYQAQTLQITGEDVARGYVEVRGGTRFAMTLSRACTLDVRVTAASVESVRITSDNLTFTFGRDGGNMPCGVRQSRRAANLDYRFQLEPNARPGTYAWPLLLTLLPM